jgi:hypothetical protein
MDDNVNYSAGFATVAEHWEDIEFGRHLDNPVVFSQIVTDDNEQPMVTR